MPSLLYGIEPFVLFPIPVRPPLATSNVAKATASSASARAATADAFIVWMGVVESRTANKTQAAESTAKTTRTNMHGGRRRRCQNGTRGCCMAAGREWARFTTRGLRCARWGRGSKIDELEIQFPWISDLHFLDTPPRGGASAMADADGKEDQPTSSVPRIIAFDLDDTLWHPEMVGGTGGSEE